jgi:hypothetical protein
MKKTRRGFAVDTVTTGTGSGSDVGSRGSVIPAGHKF